jgi:hypothetical protein
VFGDRFFAENRSKNHLKNKPATHPRFRAVNLIRLKTISIQGCQMVSFRTKNPNLGKFWRVLLAMEDVGKFYGDLINFPAIWYMYLSPFLYILPFFECCTKKNLATLFPSFLSGFAFIPSTPKTRVTRI